MRANRRIRLGRQNWSSSRREVRAWERCACMGEVRAARGADRSGRVTDTRLRCASHAYRNLSVALPLLGSASTRASHQQSSSLTSTTSPTIGTQPVYKSTPRRQQVKQLACGSMASKQAGKHAGEPYITWVQQQHGGHGLEARVVCTLVRAIRCQAQALAVDASLGERLLLFIEESCILHRELGSGLLLDDGCRPRVAEALHLVLDLHLRGRQEAWRRCRDGAGGGDGGGGVSIK